MMQRIAWVHPAGILAALLLSGPSAAQTLAPGDADAPARAAISACMGKVSEATTGLEQLEVLCPELTSGLQAAQVGSLIIPSSRERLDRQSLMLLGQLLHPPSTAAPAVSKLVPFLHEQTAGPATARPWWRRLWDWLVARLGRPRQSSSDPWLAEFARQLGAAYWLWQAIIWGTLIVLLIGAAILVKLEVGAMGRKSPDDPTNVIPHARPGPHGSPLASMRQAPLAQRPGQLFAMLISRLVSAGRLPPDRSLTHREVVRKAQLDDAEQRRLIESLARACEWQLYSGSGALPDDLDALLAQGEDLYITGWGRPMEG
jgi:hypothetical protein